MKDSKSYVVLSILAILSLSTQEGLISEAHAQRWLGKQRP